MKLKFIRRFMPLIFIMAFGTAVMSSQEAVAGVDIYYEGVFTVDNVSLNGVVDAKCVMGNLYYLFYYGRDADGNWYFGCGYYTLERNRNKVGNQLESVNVESPKIQSLKFGISGVGDQIQVSSPIDAEYDVYELETGKLLLENERVIAGDALLPLNLSNSRYLIQFKVNGTVVYRKSFIFNNNNNLFIGVQ